MKITNVIKNSPADKAGIKAGSRLVSINNQEIHDCLDYMFYGDDFGLEFGSYLMDEQRHCANKCIFCFIDQLPPNMRETLYFKDDDSRLSFLQGNYISLTNLTEREVARIIKMRLSVNVSVHTTDKALRVKMLGNPKAGEVLDYLARITRGGPEVNCQIVICPGINDGAVLEQTLADLIKLGVKSIACVPVGLTKFREGLTPLVPFGRESAAAALEIIEKYNAYASDELFLLAERELPPYEYYGDFPQYENGVGMLRLLEHEFNAMRVGARNARPESTRTTNGHPYRKSIATGVSAAPFIKQLVGESAQVYAIKNDFLGHSVTVAGLITGGDLINQLRNQNLGEELLIPETMLRAGEDVFLDDVTVGDVENALGVKVRAVAVDGGELYDALYN
jgi:putative radical SAM enzyme (TIGR03279 family)